MMLALDTSGNVAGIALMRDGHQLLEWTWHAAGNHSVTVNRLLPVAFDTVGAQVSDVTSISVCRGPGSFNGIRVGISLALGLASALGVPVVGVPSLDALAFAAADAASPVAAVVPAGRDELFMAVYSGRGTTWHRDSEYVRVSVPDAAARARPASAIVGPGTEMLLRFDASLPHLPSAYDTPRPVFLAELGRRYFESGGADQSDGLEPLYLRLSAAEEKRAADRRG